MSPAPDRHDAIIELSQPFTDIVVEIVKQYGDNPRFVTDCIPLSVKLSDFPNGGCRFSSILFGLVLRERDIVTTLVSGWQCPKCDEHDECEKGECKEGKEHVWLEYDGLVIDLTCRQFDDLPQRPWGSYGSDWHLSSWRVFDRKELTSFEVGDRRELVAKIERRLEETLLAG